MKYIIYSKEKVCYFPLDWFNNEPRSFYKEPTSLIYPLDELDKKPKVEEVFELDDHVFSTETNIPFYRCINMYIEEMAINVDYDFYLSDMFKLALEVQYSNKASVYKQDYLNAIYNMMTTYLDHRLCQSTAYEEIYCDEDELLPDTYDCVSFDPKIQDLEEKYNIPLRKALIQGLVFDEAFTDEISRKIYENILRLSQ